MKTPARTMIDRLPRLTIRFFALFAAALLGFIAGPIAAQGTANINTSVLAESGSPVEGGDKPGQWNAGDLLSVAV